MTEIKLVYSGQTNTLESTSVRFRGATGIYIQNLANNLELEFDAYLNIYVSDIETRKINLTNLRQLNILDTIDFISIPYEFANLDLDMSVTIVSDIQINISVYILIPDKIFCDLTDIENRLDSIEGKQNLQLTAQAIQQLTLTAIGINAATQNTAIVALASGLGLVLAPFTGGASLAISPAVGAPLGIGTATLIGSGLLLPA